MTAPVYPEDTDVIVPFTLPLNAEGEPLIPSSATRTVMDEAGVVISTATSVVIPSDIETTLDVTVPANLNNLTTRRGARIVEVAMTTTQGVYAYQSIYILEAPAQLVRLTNSFVTMAEALMTRRDMPGLDGWDLSTEAERNAALVAAHFNLCKLMYRYRSGISQSRITWDPYSPAAQFGSWTYVVNIAEMTSPEWALLPAKFKLALQRAQLAEADTRLRGDPAGDKRRAGIVQEVVGESSTTFSQTPDVQLAISREAMDHLSGYLYRSTRIARA